MADTERLDKLEALMWSDRVLNGVVIFPSLNPEDGLKGVCLQDLGDEDGSNLGGQITPYKPTLREAIDSL